MRQLTKTIIFSLAFLSLTIGIFPVMAQIAPIDGKDCATLGIACTGQDSVKDLVGDNGYLTRIINLFLSLMGIVAAIFIMYGGVRYIIARGDEKEAESAKRAILYAVIGLVVIGLAAAIVNFVIVGLSES